MYYKMCFKIGDKLKEKDIDTILSIIKEEAYDPSFLLDDKGYVAYGAEDNEKICMVASCKRRSLEFFIDHITDSLELRLDESGINEVSPFSFFSLVDRAERSQHMLYVGSSDAAIKNLDGLSIEKIPMTNTYMSHDHSYVSYPITLEKEIERIEKDRKEHPSRKQNKSQQVQKLYTEVSLDTSRWCRKTDQEALPLPCASSSRCVSRRPYRCL